MGSKRLQNRRPRRGAFTLIELVVAMVVVGSLSGIGVAAYTANIKKSELAWHHTRDESVARGVAGLLRFDDGMSPEDALAVSASEIPVTDLQGGVPLVVQEAASRARSQLAWRVDESATVTESDDVLLWVSLHDANSAVACYVKLNDTDFGCRDFDYSFSFGVANVDELTFEIAAGLESPPPARLPQPPLNVVAASADSALTVSWDEPSDHGTLSVEEYVVEASDGVDTHSCVTTAPTQTCAVGGLTNYVNYDVTVTATSAVGTSLASLPVVGVPEPDSVPWVSVVAGSNSATGVDPSGRAWAWGLSNYGRTGTGTTNPVPTPQPVAGGHRFVQVESGQFFTVALDTDGKAWAWGVNTYGQLGDGTTVDRSVPVEVGGGHAFVDIDAGQDRVVAIDASGVAWQWGRTPFATTAPTLVPGGRTFVDVSAGWYHVFGIDATGAAWAWGENGLGQLGDGSMTSRTTPVAVAGGHRFSTIAGGDWFSVGLDMTGRAWSWGQNVGGQLGTGSTTARTSPTAVVGGHVFTEIAAGFRVAVALKADGSAWSWGDNTINGPVTGNGSYAVQSSPMQVSGGHEFTQVSLLVSSVIAVDTSGAAWGWGWGGGWMFGTGPQVAYNPEPRVVAVRP